MSDELEHEKQATWLSLNNVKQLHNVRVVELAEQTDFSNNVARNAAFWGRIGERDLLDCNRFAGVVFLAFVDDPIRSLTNYIRSSSGVGNVDGA